MKAVYPSREEARHLAERCAKLLREQFGVQRVILFGSAAGDAPWHSHSDLDLAVEGLRPENHLAALNSCYELLPPGLELDLIPVESAWPELRARIEGEIKMPEDPMEALTFEIQSELHNLERVVERLVKFLAHAPNEPDEMQVQGAGKHLHDFYNGVERIFERIAVRVDEDVPVGSNWHTLLLQRMGQPFGARRPAVIDRPLEIELSEYLRFRHVFRHTYGYDLEWERVQELGQALPDVLKTLKTQVEAFLSALAATGE
jgi:predicted nucleotidyltransferase